MEGFPISNQLAFNEVTARQKVTLAFLLGAPTVFCLLYCQCSCSTRPATPKPSNSPIVARLRELKSARAVPIVSLVVPSTNKPLWITWQSSNTNPQFERWVVDSRLSLSAPWLEYTNGVAAPHTNFTFQICATNESQFFRVSFAWGAGAWKYQ